MDTVVATEAAAPRCRGTKFKLSHRQICELSVAEGPVNGKQGRPVIARRPPSEAGKAYRVLDGNRSAPNGFSFYVGTTRTTYEVVVRGGHLAFAGSHWATSPIVGRSRPTSWPGRRWPWSERRASNRLSNVMDAEGGTVVGLTYDAQGNLSRKNGQGYSFDLGNRLREVHGKERYLYGSGGMRAASVDAEGLRVLSHYGDSGVLVYQERRGEGALEYVSANNSVIAILKGGSVLYQHTDALGSRVATTSSSGAVEERVAYEPYGASIGGSMDGVGYAGHVMDGPAGLVYMEQRYYEPTLGRFLFIDPVGALKDPAAIFNRCKYGLNNPYKFVDLDVRAESPAWMRAIVPGQVQWHQGMTEIENGNYGRSALFFAGALTESVVGVVTLGQSQRFAAPARSLLVAARRDRFET